MTVLLVSLKTMSSTDKLYPFGSNDMNTHETLFFKEKTPTVFNFQTWQMRGFPDDHCVRGTIMKQKLPSILTLSKV